VSYLDTREAQSLIEDVLGRSFEKNRFSRLARNMLRDFDEEKLWERHGSYIREAYRDYIKSYELIGRTTLDDKKLSVLVVNIRSGKKIDGARTAMRNFVSDYLDDKGKNAALTAFISEDDFSDWRFSFIRLEKELVIAESGRVRPQNMLTPASRFSFLVGENEPHHTASQQLSHLLNNGVASLEDIERAFDVEAVTEKFFEEYKDLFDKTKEAIRIAVEKNHNVSNEFVVKNISQDHFALKLLSQIVFLYFVQKKGWLGVSKNAKWGKGNRRYLADSLKGSISRNQSFFNNILEPLFYEALATERDDCYYRNFDCRIPFLNGGLFEPINGYSWKNAGLALPNNLFEAIFGVFDRYNFTVRENEPLDKEVAVDPEMLGKVFESLISYRNQTGAFYTPSVIVSFISSYTLKHHLANMVKAVDIDELDKFFAECDSSIEFESKRAEKKKDTDAYSWKTPESIRQNAKALDDSLATIKICDPAVGSGAFLIGMMQEIVRLRKTLAVYLGNLSDNIQYELKRSCIKNSLHGVDIDSTAVDIAKLRLWLSLIVDEEHYDGIEPLPNLDYNIMQGNSLISRANGINLEGEMERGSFITIDDEQLWATLEHAKAAYFDATHFKEKQEKRKIVDVAIQEILLAKNHEQLRKIDGDIESQKKAWVNNAFRLGQEIEKLGKQRRELVEQAEQLRLIIRDISGNRQFFPWKVYFAEVFSTGGFDCVIGNPPYIQLQKLRSDSPEQAILLEEMNYHSYNRMGDIYCLFYELGCNLLKNHGILSYITSNKWMRAGYGKELREYFSNTNPLCLIDFAGQRVFNSATVDVNIMTLEKDVNRGQTESCTVKDDCLGNLSVYIKQNSAVRRFESGDSWTILSPIEENIKRKIEAIGVPLNDKKYPEIPILT
jgi:methylase of polypeptide subunit release factors